MTFEEFRKKQIKKRMKAYLSHPIRGLKGEQATEEDMQRNRDKATKMGDILNSLFKDMQVYTPASHDDFPAICYRDGYLTINDILEIDCKIMDDCDFLLVYNFEGELSGGMKVEYEHAIKNGIPFWVIEAPDGDEPLTEANVKPLVENIEQWAEVINHHMGRV